MLEPKAPFCRLKTFDTNGINFFANCWVDAEDYWDVYYYVIEYTFNEFKRNNITIPYAQLEIRERKDNVKMPVIPTQLHIREDKVRIRDEKFDLENSNLLDIFKRKKGTATKKGETKKTSTKEKTTTKKGN